ncbi:NUDIX domain-containing protein [Lysinibacillus sp. NPDC047702]|uniref:NUDIX domain-containing protein n=1 Tax=unclassified Lysinibacillus TaxID=2636778 RepID=UPI003CFEFEB2
MSIRNSMKAIIIENGKILLTKNQDTDGIFYLCPGGGQEHGETFHTALKRECIEEIGFSVTIGELLFIREYIGKNHEHAVFDSHVHQIEFYFLCHLKNLTQSPTNPDCHQIGIEWIPIERLLEYRIYPKEFVPYLQQFAGGKKSPIYLGDIN